MRIDWPYFVAAIVLLVTPSGLFHSRHVHYRPLERQWGAPHLREVLGFGMHVIDLMRGALGTWLLFAALVSVPGTRGIIRYGPLVIPSAVLFLGALLQTLVCREPDASQAPFAWVSGVVLAYCLPVNGTFSPLFALAGGFALVLAIVVALGTRIGPIFFPALAAALMGLGIALTGKNAAMKLAAVTVTALLPWLLSLLFGRHMVLAYRPRHGKASSDSLSRSPLR